MAEHNQKNRYQRLARALQCSFFDFMTHTSTHGAKYICEDDRKLFERLFWVFAILCGIGTSTFMVLNIYNRNAASPTMTVLEHTHYPTWRLPFPAISICNINRVQKTRAEMLAYNLQSETHSFDWFMNAIKHLAHLGYSEEWIRNGTVEEFQEILTDKNIAMDDLMRNLSQPCEEMLERCSWQNEIEPCSKLFTMQKTHLGFCCSFNYKGINEGKNDLEPKGLEEPIHTRLYGQRMGLTVLINPGVDDYYIASYMSTGVAVQIHDFYTYPGEQSILKLVPVNKEVLIPIRMSSKICTDAVAALSPASRECYYPHEGHLELFPQYLHENCLTECRVNNTFKICGCLPYYYPNNGKYRICTLDDAGCLHENADKLQTFKPGKEKNFIVEEHTDYLNRAGGLKDGIVCECLGQCERVSHEARVSWGDFDATQDSVNQLFGPETNHTNRILLHLFLESNFSQVSKRDVATTNSVLLALLGGICSLFLGCSFVTPVEFTYFFSVRLPGFFKHGGSLGDSCPASPQAVRRPAPLENSSRMIHILPNPPRDLY